MSLTVFATGAIFIVTYAGVALGRIPGLRLDRAGIALTGAALMMAAGAITPAEAYHAIDLDTFALLLGMMIVVAHLKLSGFFRLVSGWTLTHARSPLVLLAAVAVTTGALSAFLVNDAVCLVILPLVIEVTRSLRRDPIPYLLAVAMAANVGSTATITGNPQNMIVGAVAHIPYTAFAAALTPVAIAGLLLIVPWLAALWWGEFRGPAQLTAKPSPPRLHMPQASGENSVHAGGCECRAGLPPRQCLCSDHRNRPALQRHKQRAGSLDVEAICARPRRSTPHLARHCDERYSGRQSHSARFRGESDRGRASPNCRYNNLILDLLSCGNSAGTSDPCDRSMVA